MALLPLLHSTREAYATIHSYQDEILAADTIVYHQSGMFSVDETPARASRYSKSAVKVDLTFERAEKDWPGEVTAVELLIYEHTARTTIGYVSPDTKELKYCCTPELVDSGVCQFPYRVIVDKSASNGAVVQEVEFKKRGDGTASRLVQRTFSVEKKGLYYFMFASCNELTGDVVISGTTEWINPYGYLPGELYGFMPFYGRISLGYLVAAFVWMFVCFRHWKQLLMLQNFITVVMALGMIEMLLRYYDFHNLNKNGTRSMPLMLTAVVFTSIKKVVSRMLVLVVSMGYGVVRPTLGDAGSRILILGAVYLVFVSIQYTVESLSHSEQVSFSQYLMLLPVALLDVLFYFWIFRALVVTVKTLEVKRQGMKLLMYTRFQRILYCSVVISALWGAFYTFIVASGRIQAEWERRWIYEGFWDVIYFGILITMMVLWRPAKHAHRYAYQQVDTFDDFDYDDDDDEFDATIDFDAEEYGAHLDDSFSLNLKEVEMALSSGFGRTAPKGSK